MVAPELLLAGGATNGCSRQHRAAGEEADLDSRGSNGLFPRFQFGVNLARLFFAIAVAQVAASAAETLSSLRSRAGLGELQAQLDLAWRLYEGDASERNVGEAARWFRQAAEKGSAEAKLNLSRILFNGDVGPADPGEALRWVLGAAVQGLAEAQYDVAWYFREGVGMPRDVVQAAAWYRRAADQGHAGARFNLGVLLRQGEGVEKDVPAGVALFRLAAEQGHPDAQYGYAVALAAGESVGQNSEGAALWFSRAAEQGHAKSQYGLGASFYNGFGVPRDHAQALTWFRRAADQGNADAEFALGVMFDRGEGVPRDRQQALDCFRRAAALGSSAAQLLLQERGERWTTPLAQAGRSLQQEQTAAAREAGSATGSPVDQVVGSSGRPDAARPVTTNGAGDEGDFAPGRVEARDQTQFQGATVFDLSRIDVAPVPKLQVTPQYPRELLLGRVEGEVVVDFIVDRNGDVQNAYALRSSRREFEAAAVAAVGKWKFKPGRKGGRDVPVHMQVPIFFSFK
jgi:TonB family protein